MKEISLTKNKYALVDDDDYEKLNNKSWYTLKGPNTYYAVNKVKKVILMHRLIINCPKNLFVDHIDGNGLNNQKSNLRICTKQQNNQHKRKKDKTTSKFKGVSWSTKRKKWVAQICFNYRGKFLGYFDSEKEAALAYNKKAIELFGDFCILNAI